MPRLTKKELAALIDVVNERLAGDVQDLRDALGGTIAEAEATWVALQSALVKLQSRVGRNVESSHLDSDNV